ncbi:MAG: hypothetical protein K6F86_11180 [Lachnospiraceae bacterium]|nr:hypothetical protein [Lachnospiraceae bacterium]
MKKSRTRNTILSVAAICAAIVVVYFAIANIPKTEETVVMTETAKELAQNFDTSYPATPREVMKHYAQITKCFYMEDTTEEQIEELAKMMRKLFDDELLATQTDEEYLKSLKAEILQYREASKIVSSFSVSSSTDVRYSDNEYGSLATMMLTLNMRENGRINQVKEEFLLRQDGDGHWKILGWQLSD